MPTTNPCESVCIYWFNALDIVVAFYTHFPVIAMFPVVIMFQIWDFSISIIANFSFV